MLAWHVPYLGWTRLPADVSEFEITHFFSLRAEERSAVLTRYRDSLRLGAALQIGFLKMCGRPLGAIQRVPADSLEHLGEQLEIPAPTIATLRALYLKRRRTLYEHQRWAMEFLDMIRFEPTDGELSVQRLAALAKMRGANSSYAPGCMIRPPTVWFTIHHGTALRPVARYES